MNKSYETNIYIYIYIYIYTLYLYDNSSEFLQGLIIYMVLNQNQEHKSIFHKKYTLNFFTK